jgi:hypothetical protein
MAKKKSPEGMGWRISVSIITFFGLLVFLVAWFFFYADSYTIYQNLAVLLGSGLLFVGINAASWAPWGLKQNECEWNHSKRTRPARRKK